MDKPQYVRNQKGQKRSKKMIDPLNITETDRFFEELEAEEIEF